MQFLTILSFLAELRTRGDPTACCGCSLGSDGLLGRTAFVIHDVLSDQAWLIRALLQDKVQSATTEVCLATQPKTNLTLHFGAAGSWGHHGCHLGHYFRWKCSKPGLLTPPRRERGREREWERERLRWRPLQ